MKPQVERDCPESPWPILLFLLVGIFFLGVDGYRAHCPLPPAANPVMELPAAGEGRGSANQLAWLAFQPISLNTATVEELQLLPGIGPTLASRIVAYRARHGAFADLDQLLEVPGIGPKTMQALEGEIR